MGDLTKNFSRQEFACKCGCGRNLIKPEFVERLQMLRDRFAKRVDDPRITVISGYRCPEHNISVEGKPNGAHPLGVAADIMPRTGMTSNNRYWLLRCVFGMHWWQLVLFTRIGYNNGSFHVDIASELPQERMWDYY